MTDRDDFIEGYAEILHYASCISRGVTPKWSGKGVNRSYWRRIARRNAERAMEPNSILEDIPFVESEWGSYTYNRSWMSGTQPAQKLDDQSDASWTTETGPDLAP